MKRWVEGITREMSATQAAEVTLEARFRGLERLVRGADQIRERRPDAVRRVRAGTRRAAAALDAWAPLIGEKPVRKVCRLLKRLRRAAAEARAAEVAIAHFSGLLEAAAEDERAPVGCVLGEALRQEAASRAAFVEELERFPLAKLEKRTRKVLDSLAFAEGAGADEPALFFARRALEDAVAGVADAEAESIEGLHEVRVRLKRVRYTLELFRPLAEPGLLDSAYRGVSEWQGRLGALNDLADHVRRVERVGGLVVSAVPEERRGELSAGLDRLRDRLVRERDEAAVSLLGAWREDTVSGFVRSVSGVLAERASDEANGQIDPGGAGVQPEGTIVRRML